MLFKFYITYIVFAYAISLRFAILGLHLIAPALTCRQWLMTNEIYSDWSWLWYHITEFNHLRILVRLCRVTIGRIGVAGSKLYHNLPQFRNHTCYIRISLPNREQSQQWSSHQACRAKVTSFGARPLNVQITWCADLCSSVASGKL